jgi:hypothetical protein
MALPALLGAGLKSVGGGLVKGAAKGAATNFIKGKKTKVKPEAVKGEAEKKPGALAVRPKTSMIPAGAIVPAPIQEPTSSEPAGEKTEQDTILIIKEKVIQIQNILKGTLAADKARSKAERRGLETQKRKKQETGLEKAVPNKDKKAGKKFNVPGKGLLSGVFDFFKNLFLGWLLIKLVQIKLPGGKTLISFIGGGINFIVDLVLGILDAAGTFLAKGMEMYNATKEWLGDNLGEGAESTFEGFMSNLNKAFNLILIVGMLTASFNPLEGLTDLIKGQRKTKIDPKTGKPKLNPGEGVDPKSGKTRTVKATEIVEPDGKIRPKTTPETKLSNMGLADNQIDEYNKARQGGANAQQALEQAKKIDPVKPKQFGGFLGFLDDVGRRTQQATDFLGRKTLEGATFLGEQTVRGVKFVDSKLGISKGFSNLGKSLTEKYKSVTSGLGNLIDAGKRLAVEKIIEPLKPFIEPVAKKIQSVADNVFKFLAKTPIIQKLLEAFAKQGGAKVGLRELGSKIMDKLGSKVLPVVGGFVNLAFGYDRLAGGDTFGALIEMMAGVADIASIFPPLAPLGVLSTALDGYMFVRDMGPALLGENFDLKAGEDAIFKNVGLGDIKSKIDGFASKLPDLGTIVAMIKGEDVKQKSPEEIAAAKKAEGNTPPATPGATTSGNTGGSVKTGDLDPNSGASNVSGEAGKFIEQNLESAAVAADGYGDYNRITEHPDFGGVRGSHASGSYHYSGRAIDVGAFTNEQAPIVDVINQFNEKKGVQPAELITGASFPGTTMVDPGGHGDHVHLAYGLGGLVKGITHAMLGEKGKEFVVDNDSYTAIEGAFPGIFDAINRAKGDGAVQALMAYTDYEKPQEPQMQMVGSESAPGYAAANSGSSDSSFMTPPPSGGSSSKDILYKFG